MNDDPAPLTNVEEETPPAPAPPAPAQPPDAPPEEPTAAEVDAVEVGGQKYVPLAAVLAERREKQSLKERAAKADQLEAAVNEMLPYVDFLRQNQALMQQQPAAARPDPTADPEVEQIARDFDLYTPDGKPDVQRAARIHQRQQAVARQAAREAVQPVQASAAAQQSMANYQRASSAKLPDGQAVDQNTLNTLWRSLPAELTADQNVATMLALMATGATALTGPPRAKVAPPPNAPLVTEAPGGGPRARQPLTGLDRKVASDRGLDEAAFHKLAEGFRPGRTNVLESDD